MHGDHALAAVAALRGLERLVAQPEVFALEIPALLPALLPSRDSLTVSEGEV